eukprot:203227-Prorocentrum_minimum.AAC.1
MPLVFFTFGQVLRRAWRLHLTDTSPLLTPSRPPPDPLLTPSLRALPASSVLPPRCGALPITSAPPSNPLLTPSSPPPHPLLTQVKLVSEGFELFSLAPS